MPEYWPVSDSGHHVAGATTTRVNLGSSRIIVDEKRYDHNMLFINKNKPGIAIGIGYL